MAAIYSDLYLEQGASFSTSITIYDNNGYLYNLTGLTAESEIRSSYYAANTTAIFAANTGVDPTLGVLTLSLDAPNTANIWAGTQYVYDVKLSSSNNVIRILEGRVFIEPSVSR